MADWADLAALRAKGKRPRLTLVLSTVFLPQLAEIGAMVIVHRPGKSFPAQLLDGLDVWLMLGSCDRAQAVVRALKAKGVQPRSVETWCECRGELSGLLASCFVAQEWAA